ncbi:hypothetical protein BKK54_08355 [Rodentibacter genomosp. 1]|uniref:Uncharacterized protein n=1 Tax=Rodentibacter genomosp. 1 TaxID=1908264 RepID=A0A1V3J3H5_9PAST|nr:hypothetical protein [Rodentibacter genomosp. 1]OOF49682.1 hypothetical protein BKK54_08355 [Rodentibacter genomosp. 1]
MHKNLIGQTAEQKRNYKEQRKRREEIKKKFPKTITYYTYEPINKKIEKKAERFTAIFEKLKIKYRKSELKSLAITYYIHTYKKEHLRKLFLFIYKKLVTDEASVDDLIRHLNRKFSEIERKWNKELIIKYLLFKN